MLVLRFEDAGGDRGLVIARFKDHNGIPCSVQTSSLASEPCIWLGQQHCEECEEPTRMHLTQEMAEALIPVLRHFVETGDLPAPLASKEREE